MKKLIKNISVLCLLLGLSIFSSKPVYSTNYLTSFFSFGNGSTVPQTGDNSVENIVEHTENNVSTSSTVNESTQRNRGWLHTMFGDSIDVKPFSDAATDLCTKMSHTLGIFIGVNKPVSKWTEEDYKIVKEKMNTLSNQVETRWKKDMQPFLNNFKKPLHKVEVAADGVKSASDSLIGLVLWIKAGIGSIVLVAITGFFYMLIKLKDRSKRLERAHKKKIVSRKIL